MTLNHEAKIYVAGHRGLVGAAVVRALRQQGYGTLVVSTHREVDLTEQAAVRGFFERERPQAVVMAAALYAWSVVLSTGTQFAHDRYFDASVIWGTLIPALAAIVAVLRRARPRAAFRR